MDIEYASKKSDLDKELPRKRKHILNQNSQNLNFEALESFFVKYFKTFDCYKYEKE